LRSSRPIRGLSLHCDPHGNLRQALWLRPLLGRAFLHISRLTKPWRCAGLFLCHEVQPIGRCAGAPASIGSTEWRTGLCCGSPDRHRNHGPADFGLKIARHFRRLTRTGNRLAALHKCSDMLGCAFRDVSHRVLVGVAVSGEVPKVGNAGDEAVALANEDCPVPDPRHASLPLFQPKAARRPPREEQRIPAKGCIPGSRRQSQNLTHLSVFWRRESPTYQPRAKSIPRAEKRP
jgi:hypothetical protein